MVEKGHSFNLKCHITGTPLPSIEWKKVDSKALSYSSLLIYDNELVALSAKTSDAGTYMCVANNVHGEVKAYANVTVVGMFNFVIERLKY